MSMHEEGVIKYYCLLHKQELPLYSETKEINRWRKVLYQHRLIGVDQNGIGFGNISARVKEQQFIISGSGTGNISHLSPEHFALVESFDIDRNQVVCKGLTKASSESMSHGALYAVDENIKAIIHVHHLGMWKQYLNKLPTTGMEVPYGTPEMAREIQRLYQNSDLSNQRILVMGGHKEGLITFGTTMDEAGEVLMKHFRRGMGDESKGEG